MFVEILIMTFAGAAAGIVTGLTPGVHINLVSLIILSISGFLLKFLPLPAICCFIISMSIVHQFLDSIPSIFLGAPDSDMALGVLPGHRYLLKGNGMMAVKLTLIGSFGAIILSIIFFPLFMVITKYLYPLIKDYVGYILIMIALFMILRDRKKLWAALVFSFSGILGIIVFSIPNFNDPLFPLLSGLFGISTLIYSIKEKNNIPKQKIMNEIKIKKKLTLKALTSGMFSGFLTAILPGVGANIAAILSIQITKNLKDYGFMILIGAINTYNFVFSIITFYVISKPRNGPIVVIQRLVEAPQLSLIICFICIILMASAIAIFLTLKIGKGFSKLITKVNYTILVSIIIFFIIGMTIFMTGWLGFLILIVSLCVGLIPAIVKVGRIQAMGCLILPVIFYFIL